MRRQLRGWMLAAGVVSVGCAAQAVTIVKTNNVDNLNLTTSWKGGVTPKANDIAQWNNTVTGTNAVLLGANLSYQGISILNPGGPVAIGGANTLTNGFQGINLGTATADLVITNSNLTLLDYAGQIWNVTNSRTLTVSPATLVRNTGAALCVQGAGTVTSSAVTNDATGLIATWASFGTGTSMKYATLSGGNIVGYTGAAAATAANVADTTGATNYDVAGAGTLGAGASFNTLRYTGAAGGLAGDFMANGLLNAGAGTLTLSNSVTVGARKELVLTSPDSTRALTLRGIINDGAGGPAGLTVTGGGQVSLYGSNAFSGVTIVSMGALAVYNANALGTTGGNTVVYSTGRTTDGGQLALGGGVTVAEPVTLLGPGDAASGGYTRAIDAWSVGTNTLSGTVTLTGASSYRIGANVPGAVLSLGLIQRSTASGNTLVFDPTAGSTVTVYTAIHNSASGLTCHNGGTVVLNASSNDIGDTAIQNSTTLKITATDALATNRNLTLGQPSAPNTASGSGNDVGTFYLEGASQSVNALYGCTNGVGSASATDKRRITSTSGGAMTLTVGNGNGIATFDGVIENGSGGGTLALTKIGSGSQTLVGTRPNTYTGLTTVNGGTLTLAKTAGTNAVSGNILIGAGTLANGLSHQIADTANVTLTTASSQWNLGGFYETVANVDVQNAGGTSLGLWTGTSGRLTVTGTLSHALGTVTLNSGGTGSTIDANALVNTGGNWVFGTTVASTQILNIASGGLTIGGGSTIQVDAPAICPNYISLSGDVTSQTNANANSISGAGQLRLNGTRTFNVADGAAASDLTISAIMADGTGTGALTKNGLGTLTISGTNAYSGATTVSAGTLALSGALNGSSVSVASGATFTESAGGVIAGSGVGFANSGTATLSGTNIYTGTTAVNAGVLSITATNALPGWDTNGRYTVASGAALVIGNAVSNSAIPTLLGTGNFAAGASIGFDTSSGDRTYAPNLADAGAGALGVAKVGANTLTLTGTNTYTGALTVFAGNVSIPYTNALPGWDTNGRYLVYSNATLVVGTAVSNSSIATMIATTNFAAGASIGFDTTLGNRTFGNIISNTQNGALGVVKVGTNTLTLSGSNVNDGVMTVSLGILAINNASALGTTNGGTYIYSTGGTLTGGKLEVSGGLTLAEPIVLFGPGEASPYVDALVATGGSNTLAGTVTLTGTAPYRIGASSGAVLNIGLIQRNGATGSNLVLDPSGMLNVNMPIVNKAGDLLSHSGGTVTLNATGNDLGNVYVQYTSTLKLGATDALNTNKVLNLGGVSTDPNGERGSVNLAGFSQTVNSLNGNGTNAGSFATTRMITNSAAALSTLTVGNVNGSGSFNGFIAGNIALTKVGTGTQLLFGTGTNTYSGDTTVYAGTLAISNTLALQKSTLNLVGGALSFGAGLNAFTFGGLAGSQNLGLTNAFGTAIALTVGNNNSDSTYSGSMSGAGSLVKIGTGKLTLAGVNTYTGSTTITNGTLALGRANALGSGTQIILAGGTLDPGAYTNSLSALNITSAGGTIALGDGSCALSFANSSGQTWSGTLNITGTWGPTSLRFGTDATGLTQAQLSNFKVGGHKVWVQQDSQGYLRKLTGTLLRLL